MIFSVEIAPEEAAIMDKTNLKNCLNRLLQAHRDGIIYLIFNRKNSLWFLENIDLHPENEYVLNRILSQISTTGNLKNIAYHKVSIVYSILPFNSDINVKYIELDEEKIINLIKPPVIVVENLLNDGRIIKYICDNYMRKINIRNISMDIHSGSGSQVLDTAKHHCENGRITLAITDRDSIFPSSNQNIISYKDNYYYYILPCHEIENLFGLECISKYKGINKEMQKTIEFLSKIEAKEGTCNDPYFIYFDLKKGFSHRKFISIADTKAKSWIEGKISSFIDTESDFNICGLGENICRNIIGNNYAMSAFKDHILSNRWDNIFGDFFSKILWVLCSSPVI